MGNILFNDETVIQDSFDVINADAIVNQVLRQNSVTFFNNLDNVVTGFDNSNDVINAQAGNDIIDGLSGDDLLRGGDGDDILIGGLGADTLNGGSGNNILSLGIDTDIDTVVYRGVDNGFNVVSEFTRGTGGDLLSFEGVDAIDVINNGSSTFFRLSDGIAENAGFGTGQLLLELRNASGFTADTLGLNLASSNTARFLFA